MNKAKPARTITCIALVCFACQGGPSNEAVEAADGLFDVDDGGPQARDSGGDGAEVDADGPLDGEDLVDARQLLPARMGIGGLTSPGNVAVAADRIGMEWSRLRVVRRGDGELDVDAILDGVDCLVLPGGADIDPAVYGEEAHPTINLISEARAEFDFAVLQGALERRMPILGICLGGQELNVLQGGALVQDIPSEVEDFLDHRAGHSIEIVPGTLMDELYDSERIDIYSNHHQAAEDGAGLGDGLIVSAWSADGVVEAFEAADRDEFPFVFGTQYHPEQQLDSGLHDGLFKVFEEACLAYQADHPRTPDSPDHGDTTGSYGACQSDLGPGVCLDVDRCAEGGGAARSGLCDGPSNIQCCSQLVCTTGAGHEGQCFSVDICDELGGVREAFLCPGNAEVQCCAREITCRLSDGADGTCLRTERCDENGGRREAGRCPGPSNIQCCSDG